MSSALIIPKDIQKNVIGETTLSLTNIDLREADKSSPFNELLKKNTLFRYMVLFLFSNSPIKSNSIKDSRQLLYLILQINKRDIELYLKERKEKGDAMAYQNKLEYIENANTIFTNEKYNDFKKKFYDIINTVNLDDLFDDILDIEDIDKNTFSSVFTNQEFTEFKNKLKTIKEGDLQIQDLNETKVRNELIGAKGIVGTNIPKRKKADKIANLDEYLSPKEYEKLSDKMKNNYEDSEVNNHLNLIAKFEDSKPILYDDIMNYIEIEKHFVKETDDDIIAANKANKANKDKRDNFKIREDRDSFRIEFDQYTYLKNIFKKFGFEDIEDTGFELHSSLLKKQEMPKTTSGKRKFEGGEDRLIENIKGKLSKENNYLVYLAPVYEGNEFTKIQLVGTQNIQEYDVDNSGKLNSLQTEINELGNKITKANLKNEIEKALLKNTSSDLPFVTSILSSVSPTDGKINLGKFTMVITFNDLMGKKGDIDDVVNQVRQLTKIEGSDTKKKGQTLFKKYEAFVAFFQQLERNDFFDSKEYGKNNKKFNIVVNTKDFSDKAQTEGMKNILTVIITTLEKNLMSLKDNEEQKKNYIEEKIKELKDAKKKKKLSSEFLSEPNFKPIDLQYFDEIISIPMKLEPIEINTQNIIEDIFAKNTKRYQDDIRTVKREDAVKMFIKAIDSTQKKLQKPNSKLERFIGDLKDLQKLLKNKNDGRIGQKKEAYEVPEKRRLLPNISNTGLTEKITYDMLDAYMQLKDSNINNKEYFETFAEEQKRVKTIKSFIPIVTEGKYNFNKRGSVNVRRYKIKWESTTELTSKKKKETEGKFSDTVTGNKNETKEVNVKLNKMLDVILRNFKTLQGMTR